MSRIIRGVQISQTEAPKVEIKLRNAFIHSTNEEEIQYSGPTMEDLIQEREQLLQQAQAQMEAEREQFEQYRNEQLMALEQLKQLWEEEKQQLQQQAYDKAFSEGYEEGIQKASASMEETLQMVNTTMDNAIVNADKYINDQEQVILHLAIKSAEKIIGLELDQNNEAFVSIIRRALKEVRECQMVKVYVPAQYYELITSYRDELAEMFPPDIQFLIFVHEDLTEQQCFIETNHGRIIVSIDEQLQQLRLKLSEILDSKE